ncbi:MAG: caspase family protein [Caldilineaceae bacterium]
MSRTIYTFLVGIDAYPAPVNPLRGCVNDIQRVEALLRERVHGQGDTFAEPHILTDAQATRQAVVDGFRTYLTQAKAGDVALFYYSGHGSQSHTPPEFLHLEPDGLDETIVCWDSRQPGNWDLADKELAQLIAEVAKHEPHIAVILDCCHSGSGTREVVLEEKEEVRVRRVPTDDRVRPASSFLVSLAQAEALDGGARGLEGGGWYNLAKGRHILLAACSPEELAKELYLGGEQRGAFSYFLLDTLQRGGEALTYRDLFKRVNALVRARVAAQSPQMEATQGADLEQPFLGGSINSGPGYYTLRQDKQRGWVIDGGAVHGIPVPADNETTQLAIFPFDANVKQLDDLEQAIGEATVTQVFPGESAVQATFTSGQALDGGTTYKAVVTALPLTPLLVALEGDAAGLALVRTALESAGADGGASLLVHEGTPQEAELILRAEENRYHIRRRGDAYALVVDTPGFVAASADLVVQRLEHIARWRKIIELSNAASRLTPGAVQMEVLLPDEQGEYAPAPVGSNVRLDYRFQQGEWVQPTFKVRLKNTSKQRLYCTLFDLTETYGVFPVLATGGAWLDQGQTIWALDGEPIYGAVPEELWQEGVVEFKDTLKLIVSTDESDANQLQQDDLPVVVTKGVGDIKRKPTQLNTLNRLMHRVQTRTFSARPANAESLVDWVTAEVSFTTVRPLEAVVIGKPGEKADLGHNVTIQGHAKLKAAARLTTLPDATRDLGAVPLPALVRDHAENFTPFTFSASRGGEAGLSVLELVDVEDYTVVTPDEPLIMEVATALAANEQLLVYGHDGEFFLPVGRATNTATGLRVILTQLPAPTGTRDLKGSIKILFQKLANDYLGWSYTYPQLAVATVNPQGGSYTIDYNSDEAAVRAAVADADRIVLYVHGIIGDTRGMALSAYPERLKTPVAVKGLHQDYDLLLTFDYENLKTTIEDNARLLKQRLAAVGLGPDHGKTLHIVAHSMGGLVSRWFIEQEEGNQVVQQLIMLGTPNAGSPWSTVEDYALAMLGIGLNGLAQASWPGWVISALVAALEQVDVSLDQMKPGSDFLQELAASADPGIPYTIIAGNTALVAAALEAEAGKVGSRFSRLWQRIKPKHWLYKLTAPVFYGSPNDIAVTVESINGIPANHQQVHAKVESACDHLTYFSTEAGLAKLAAAVAGD